MPVTGLGAEWPARPRWVASRAGPRVPARARPEASPQSGMVAGCDVTAQRESAAEGDRLCAAVPSRPCRMSHAGTLPAQPRTLTEVAIEQWPDLVCRRCRRLPVGSAVVAGGSVADRSCGSPRRTTSSTCRPPTGRRTVSSGPPSRPQDRPRLHRARSVEPWNPPGSGPTGTRICVRHRFALTDRTGRSAAVWWSPACSRPGLLVGHRSASVTISPAG